LGELSNRTYQLNFNSKNFDATLLGYLKDEYNGNVTLIGLGNNVETNYTFEASDALPGSKSANRFTVMFALPGVTPVNFSSVKAIQQNNAVKIDWDVENEINVDHYNIERSKDGIHFNLVASKDILTSPSISKQYSWTDVTAEAGINFYRIVNVNKNGTVAYSKVLKVEAGNITTATINVYPTVVNDGVLSLQFNNSQKGIYMLRLINTTGQVLLTKTITHSGGNTTQTVHFDRNVSKGMCQLNIVGPDKNIFQSVKLINR
jgi:hypothetical protein